MGAGSALFRVQRYPDLREATAPIAELNGVVPIHS